MRNYLLGSTSLSPIMNATESTLALFAGPVRVDRAGGGRDEIYLVKTGLTPILGKRRSYRS